MVEVFRTNVHQKEQAGRLLRQLKQNFNSYRINFDLSDCDRILRIESDDEIIEVQKIMDMLCHLGFRAEILPDEVLN